MDRMALLLGRVVQASAFLEHQLRVLTTALLGSKYAVIATAGQTASKLIELARNTSEVRGDLDENDRSQLKALLSRASVALAERNRVAHGAWGLAGDGEISTFASRYYQPGLNTSAVTEQGLEDNRVELAELGRAIHAWTIAKLPDDASNEMQLRSEKLLDELPPQVRDVMIKGRAMDLIASSTTPPFDDPRVQG